MLILARCFKLKNGASFFTEAPQNPRLGTLSFNLRGECRRFGARLLKLGIAVDFAHQSATKKNLLN